MPKVSMGYPKKIKKLKKKNIAKLKKQTPLHILQKHQPTE